MNYHKKYLKYKKKYLQLKKIQVGGLGRKYSLIAVDITNRNPSTPDIEPKNRIRFFNLDGTVKRQSILLSFPIFPSLTQHSNKISIGYEKPLIALCSSRSSFIQLFDVTTDTVKNTISVENAKIHSCVFSPHDNIVAGYYNDNTIKLWNVNDGTLKRFFDVRDIYDYAFSPDEEIFMTYTYLGDVNIYKVNDGTLIQTFHNVGVFPIFSPDSKYFATNLNLENDTYQIKIFDISNGTLFRNLTGRGAIKNIKFNNTIDETKMILATCHENGEINFWNIFDGTLKRNFCRNENSIENIIFSPDEQIIVGSSYNNIMIWNIEDGKLLHTIHVNLSIYFPLKFMFL